MHKCSNAFNHHKRSLMRKKLPQIILFFAFNIGVYFIILIWLLYNLPEPKSPLRSTTSNLFYSEEEFNHTLTNNLPSENTKISYKSFYLKESEISFLVQTIFNNSFLAYWENCKNSDYIQPISKKCLNSSRLSLTAIESLQMLFLTGFHDIFAKVEEYLVTNYHFNSSKSQNFSEMGSKLLGSLLGIYGFTRNLKFLDKAIECADIMVHSFTNSIPHPLLDGLRKQPKKYAFLNGNILSESSSFILEFSILSQITHQKKYERFVTNYLNCMEHLIQKSHSLPFFVSVDQCEIIDFEPSDNQPFELLNEYTASFLANLMRLHLYRPSYQTHSLIDMIVDIFSNSTINHNSKIFCSMLNLIEKIPKMKISKLYFDLNSVCSSSFKQNSFKDLSKFKVHLTDLIEHEETDENELFDIINASICGSFQCSLVSIDPLIYEDFMPSESFSKWLKLLILRNLTTFTYSETEWIFNEMGHILPIRFD